MPPDAIRQAVLLLAFLISLCAMVLTWLRGGDLLHVAFTALWVLPTSAMIIFHIFRLWFVVLSESIRKKQAHAPEGEEADPKLPKR